MSAHVSEKERKRASLVQGSGRGGTESGVGSPS